MMKTTKTLLMLLTVMFFSLSQVMGQQKSDPDKLNDPAVETYLLEREMTDTSKENLVNIATGAKKLVDEMGPKVEWVHSYVTDNKMICVFKYQTQEALSEHASRAGLKVSDLKKVETVIGPETAEN